MSPRASKTHKQLLIEPILYDHEIVVENDPIIPQSTIEQRSSSAMALLKIADMVDLGVENLPISLQEPVKRLVQIYHRVISHRNNVA
jgi:hypothetical protein